MKLDFKNFPIITITEVMVGMMYIKVLLKIHQVDG